MGDLLRYQRAEDLLNLAIAMANSRQGLSIGDIGDRFEVSRRTAERMRDAIVRVFPEAIETRGNDRIKRWHIPKKNINNLISITSDDLAAINIAKKLAQSNNIGDVEARLDDISAKLTALIDQKTLGRIEPDLEALIEEEGLAIRQGPRPYIDTEHMEEIRHAIKACSEITITYTARGSGKTSKQQLQPYGFLYGNRHYLVAYSADQDGFRLYSLSNIKKVKLIDKSFERSQEFDLQEYAAQSFGVFQEAAVKVVLKISPDAASDAREYMFHPTQKIEEKKDGSLLVSFTAGGMLEMCWELFKWGNSIEIIEPEALKKTYKRRLDEVRLDAI